MRRAASSDGARITAIAAAVGLALDGPRELALPQTVAWVATADEVVIGALVAWYLPPDVEIIDVAVIPAHQRRGVGRRLLRELLAWCKTAGAEQIVLELRDDNASARALYAAAGFRTIDRRANYYRHPPADALVQRVLLDPDTGKLRPDPLATEGHS